MYTKILVPMALDHGISGRTLEVARTLLSEGGTIHALHVHEAPQGSVGAFLDEDVVKGAFEAARERLQERVADLPDVSPVLVMGHTSRTIIDFAADKDVDCIVLGSHKPGMIDYFLGSTAARVVRHAPCDVHVVRTSAL